MRVAISVPCGSEKFPAPQGTLMATLIKGLLAANLDWQYVLVGVFLSVTMELCGVRSLAFAVGAYLPLSTTLPIFVGGVIRWVADRKIRVKEGGDHGATDEMGPGNLFSTGLVAGGALGGVLVAFLTARAEDFVKRLSLEEKLTQVVGTGGYQLVGVAAFSVMGAVLYGLAIQKGPGPSVKPEAPKP